MTRNTTTMRFDEDKFDLTEHRKAASADKREKDRLKRVRRQVKIGKISLAIVSIIIFFALFFVATQLGWMNFS